MKMWSAEPVLFTQRDYEGHRLRLVVAEKHARCVTRIVDRLNPAPEYLAEVNPDNTFPVLIDKHLIAHGPALDELFHERYPGPTLLPTEPLARAQHRMLADRVRSWYPLRADELSDRVLEVASAYNEGSLFFAGSAISIIDIALMPILYEMPQKLLGELSNSFLDYRMRLLSRPSLKLSMKPYVPANEMFPEDLEDDDEDDIGLDDLEAVEVA